MGAKTLIRRPSIDIGLTALCKLAKPEQTLSQEDIAEVCQCTAAAISRIERRAKAKIAEAIITKYGASDALYFEPSQRLKA